MAKGKKGFILYADLIHTVNELDDSTAGKLFKHLLKYVNDENPTTDDPFVKLAFIPIQQQLKRDLKHWESIRQKRSEAGKLGGRPKANKANAFFVKQTKANESKKSSNSKCNSKCNSNSNSNSNKREGKHLFKNSPFYDFIKFENEILKDEKYACFDILYYFEAVKNWSSGGAHMKVDWISTAKNWMIKDSKEQKPKLNKQFNDNDKLQQWRDAFSG